MEQNKCDFQQ